MHTIAIGNIGRAVETLLDPDNNSLLMRLPETAECQSAEGDALPIHPLMRIIGDYQGKTLTLAEAAAAMGPIKEQLSAAYRRASSDLAAHPEHRQILTLEMAVTSFINSAGRLEQLKDFETPPAKDTPPDEVLGSTRMWYL